MSPYAHYYSNQAGSGIAGFHGVRYQRGHGFFGRFFKGVLPTILKYLGKQTLKTGLNVADDILEGNNLKESIRTRVGETGRNVVKDAIKRGNRYIQTGEGRRKRKRLSSKKTIKRTRSKSRTTKRRRIASKFDFLK